MTHSHSNTNSSFQHKAFLTLLVALSVIGAFVVIGALRAIPLAYSNVPFWDEWVILERIAAIERGEIPLFETFWAPHAGHRQFLHQLLLYANARWFDYQSYPVILFSIACQILIAGLYADVTRRLPGPWERKALAAVLILPVLFSSFCLENTIWKMQVAYVWAYSSVFLGLHTLSVPCTGRKRSLRLLFAILCGLVASLNRAEGLIFWPAAILLCVVNRSHWRDMAWLGGVGAVMITLFLHGNTAIEAVSDEAPGTTGATHLLKLLLHSLLFIGGPATHLDNRLALTAGVIFIASAIPLTIRALRGVPEEGSGHEPPFHLRGFLIGTLAFSTVSLLAVVVGRHGATALDQIWHAGRGGFLVVSRYMNLASYAWLSLLLLSLAEPGRNLRRASSSVVLVCVSLLFLATLPIQQRHSAWWVDFFRHNDAVGSALIVGVDDPEGFRRLSENPSQVEGLRNYLQENALAHFAEPRAEWTAMSAVPNGLPEKPDPRCRVDVQHVKPLDGPSAPPAFKLTGTLLANEALGSVEDLLIVDQSARILGLGRIYAPANFRAGPMQKWIGYTILVPDLSKLRFAIPRESGSLLCVSSCVDCAREP